MSDAALTRLTEVEARRILTDYAQRALGATAAVASATYREDYGVWEAWVSGPAHYVKAYIVRLGPEGDGWVCRHITVSETPPRG